MSDSNVVGLRGDPVLSHGEPDAELLDFLESLLADARSGSLRAIAYVCVSNERHISTGWEGHCDQHDIFAGVSLLDYHVKRGLSSIDNPD